MVKKKVMSVFCAVCVVSGIYTGYRLMKKHSFGENPKIETNITYDSIPMYKYRYKYLNANGKWSEFSPWLDFKPTESTLRYIESKIEGYKFVPKEKEKIGDQSRNKMNSWDSKELSKYNNKMLYLKPKMSGRKC